MIAVGVDVAEEAKGLDLVALDSARSVVASAGRLRVADVVSLIRDEIDPDLVCIDSPPGWARTGRSRASERALGRLGHRCFYTPQDPGDHPFYRWVRVGIEVFSALSDRYPLYRGGPPAGRAAEVFPHATARVLAGRPRAPGESKVAFRRHALTAAAVGHDALPSGDRVDAALAALTGLFALCDVAESLGDAEEGMVLVPRSSSQDRCGPFEVRRVGLDSPLVAPLLAGLAGEYRRRYGSDEEMSRATAGEFVAPGGAFVVALDGVTTVAGGGLRRFAPTVAEVKRMWTHPAYRRRGLAAQVLGALESTAADLGYGKVILETGPRQPEAEALYRALGYRPIPPYGHYETALGFEKELDVPAAGA